MIGTQAPRVRWAPPYARSRVDEVVQVAETVGLHLDEFQIGVLTDACGVREDEKWSAFEVGGDIPRQNGKGGIIEARELAGVFAFGERLQLHSAHEFQTATEAMLRMEDLLAADPWTSSQVKSVSRSHGAEGFVFKSGQRLRYRTRTKGGGRGFTGDTLYLDEAMVLPEMFIGALLPTLSGRSLVGNPQVWYLGSAVDRFVHEHGLVFARLRARGHAGGDRSLAWFEWSGADALDAEGKPITPDHYDVVALLADRAAWAAANPGLGIRISAEHIEKELRSMDPRTFAVERLGIGDWPDVNEDAAVISLANWSSAARPDLQPIDPVAVCFDVAPDRSSASVVVVGPGPDGVPVADVVRSERGTAWVVPAVLEVTRSRRVSTVVCDAAGAAGALVYELDREGLRVETVSAREHAEGCGLLYDLVDQKDKFHHRAQAVLTGALRAARKRPLGGAWAWDRKTATDISSLVAVTLAVWAYLTKVPKPVRVINLATVEA